MIKKLRVAFIGSRSLHDKSGLEEDIRLCEKVAYRFAELDIVGVSGLCYKGMDAIMQRQYSRAISEGKAFQSQLEVYVAKQTDIHRSRLPNKHLAKVRNPALKRETEAMASRYHHAWHNCSPDARGLHSRNCHIIFGYKLDKPVDAVVTWCELDRNNEPMGGTGVAIRMALDAQIPVFNLYLPDKKATLNQIRNFLKHKKVWYVK